MSKVLSFGPSVGLERRVADDRVAAALDRAVEGLGDDPRADAGQAAAVELGLAQDVEPQRRVLEERRALRRRRARRGSRRRSRRGSAPWSAAVTRDALGLHELAIPCPVASLTIFARARLRNARLAMIASAGGEVAPNEPGGSAASGFDQQRVDPHRLVGLRGRHLQRRLALNSYSRRQSAIQLLGSREPLPRNPLVPVKRTAGPACPGRCRTRVPVVRAADHAVPEPERRDRELDRHRRHVRRRRADLEDLAAVGEDVVDDRRVADPRQVVVADHPLVVLDHRSPRAGEALRRRHRGPELVDHPVVEADDRAVRLRDGEVLVVAEVGDVRVLLPRRRRAAGRSPAWPPGGPSPPPRSSRSSAARRRPRRTSPSRVAGPGAVERVEVERSASGPAAGRPGETFVPSATIVRSKVRSWSMNCPR